MAAVLLNVDAAFGCSTKAKAYVTAMKSDLRNLVSAQEAFLRDNNRYALSTAELGNEFQKSTGVSTVTISPTPAGYTARATHTQIAGMCIIYVGARSSGIKPPNGLRAAEPWCEEIEQPGQVASVVAFSFWICVLVLTIATGVFLSPPRGRSWPARGLVVLSVAYPLMVFPSCGYPSLSVVALFVMPALALFTVALRSRLVLRAV